MNIERPAKLRGVIQPAAERLEARSVSIPFCGCRIYLGASVPRGYGVLSVNDRQTYAHRVAWQVANGPIPEGLKVLHTCDVPACINPDHLFLGTDADNMADKMNKGRHRAASREGHGHVKLTEADVDCIRTVAIRGDREFGYSALARKYGVHPSTVLNIVNGNSWR